MRIKTVRFLLGALLVLAGLTFGHARAGEGPAPEPDAFADGMFSDQVPTGNGTASEPDAFAGAGGAFSGDVQGMNIEGPEAEGNMVVEIEVLNTVTTSPEQIRYRMSTRVGHPLRERILEGDFQRLSAMGVFDDIQIRKEFVEGGIKIIVAVREKDIIRRIEFRNNRQIKTRKLRSLIESKVGERFDAGKGNRDKRAIEDFLHKEYYYFGEVDVEVEPFEDGVRLVFDLTEGGRLYVADIEFRGNTVFTRKALLAKMETKRSGLVSRGKYLRRAFERDLERVRMAYLDEGYLDARIIERPFEITANVPKSRWQRRDAYIHIDVEEGERYYVGTVNFQFEGSSLVPEEKIRAFISTMPGAPYSPIKAQEDAKKIRDAYGQYPNSRYFTRVIPEPEVTEEGTVMDVTFHIQESPEITIEGVRVTGLTHTKEFVVLREFELFPGEKMDSRKFNRSKENIQNLGYFQDPPKVEVREGSAPDRAILVAELEEISTGKVTAGVGVSSKDDIVGSVGLSQRNFDYKDWPKSFKDFYTGKAFRGAGQSFAVNASIGSKSQNYNIDFTNPWIFGKPISMSLGAFYSYYEYDEYTEGRAGASIAFGKRLFGLRQLTGTIGYRLEQVKLKDFQRYVSPDYRSEEGTHNVSRWITGLQWDSRDSVFEPTKGLLASLNFELAGAVAGSSKDFWRSFASTQYFIPFYTDKEERNWTLGFRVDGGVAKSYGDEYDLPYYESLYAGGVGSVRGYSFRGISPRGPRSYRGNPNDNYNDPVGGEGMVTASVELSFPIWERIVRGSVFYDTGTVWSKLSQPSWDGKMDDGSYYVNTSRDFRSSFGFGLHIKTPLGPMPVRLYYSIPINKREGDDTQRFQFTMGALF